MGGDACQILCPCCEAKLCRAPDCELQGSRLCGNCKKARYCTKSCQRAHWKRHKPFCYVDDETEVAALKNYVKWVFDSGLLNPPAYELHQQPPHYDNDNDHGESGESSDVSAPLDEYNGRLAAAFPSVEIYLALNDIRDSGLDNMNAKLAHLGCDKSLHVMEFFNTMARKVPEAVEVAKEIGLELPAEGEISDLDLDDIMFHLVAVGKDGYDYFPLFLGYNFERGALTAVRKDEGLMSPWQHARMMMLYPGAEHGSEMWQIRLQYKEKWAPRPYAKAEEERAERVTEMQQIIQIQSGRRLPTYFDKHAILKAYGANRKEVANIYDLAVKSIER